SRSFFPQKKNDDNQTHSVPKRQSAERSSASVRSTPKKKPEKNRGKLACIRFLRFFFNTDCRVNHAANFQCQNAGSLLLS
ncbi:MAG: hypothetical protein IJA59_07965, partial [Clostridia bacterium]|nr:hypothetical protein [Clostridia bacterium]